MPAPLCNALGDYVDLLLDAVCAVDREGRFEFLSSGAERIFGYPAAEMLGKSMLSFVHPADRAKTLEAASAINTGQIRLDFENRYIRKDGQIVHLLWSARWSADKQQRVAVARDISKLKQAETRQRALYAISEAAFAAENLPALYYHLQEIVQQLIPIDGFVIARLTAADTLTLAYQYIAGGFGLESVLAEDCYVRLLAADSNGLPSVVQCINQQSAWLGVTLKSPEKLLGALIVKTPEPLAVVGNDDAELLEFVAQHIATAIERKELLARLHHYALYDDLTQLPKRELFYDRCRQGLANAQRNSTRLAICYLDLDGFKPVNDVFGHAIGDALLQQVALRLQQSLRKNDTVSRFGGDEFVVLFSDVTSAAAVLAKTETIRLELSRPFILGSHVISITPSIGIALYPEQGETAEQLLALADQAMYQAKQQGGNCCVLR
ncbi:diguanylate cyclase [Alishewanella longhuensis]|uniref:Diguanylate cyclase n=1 Tax=Alishewanella longhuensis TaxID=1091037 RepID=A0ABQ3L1F8_9ALTE|nr:GGDEF domain-containing protein [Alishewanella longhuensis]GHG75284.1 diguanylate cyclase [Alishewanella longhuensis]